MGGALLSSNTTMASGAIGSAVIRRIISTPKAPAAIGPYSQAVVVDRTMYVSGQIGMSPETGELVSDNVVDQARQVLTNMGNVLEAAGVSFKHVVKTTVLFSDLKDFQEVNKVYAEFFKDHQPARAAYQAAALPKGAKLEIEAIAVIGDITDT